MVSFGFKYDCKISSAFLFLYKLQRIIAVRIFGIAGISKPPKSESAVKHVEQSNNVLTPGQEIRQKSVAFGTSSSDIYSKTVNKGIIKKLVI